MSHSVYTKMTSKFVSAVVVATLAQGPVALAANPPTPAPTVAPAELSVNPETLRHRVLENNLSLEQELNTVKDAKDQVNVARGQLLPSLNLGTMVSSGPGFLISSIQFLLPFLFPSNWMNLSAAEDEFNANKIAYKIMELNVYSSALAVYYTILADVKLEKAYDQQAKDLMQIYEINKTQADLLGTVPQEILDQLKESADQAQGSASKMAELIVQETAAIRQVMGLPLTTVITYDDQDMPASELENAPVSEVVAKTLAVAPENQQIDYLIKAAQAKKFSASFGFLNSATLSSAAANGKAANFGNMTGGLNFHFGFDYFPNLSLAARNIDEVKLQKTQLTQTVTQTVEAFNGSIKEVLYQHEKATEAEALGLDAFNILNQKYQAGIASMLDVLTARTLILNSTIARINSEQDLNQQRVNVHRALLTDQFAQIHGCGVTQQPAQHHGFFGGIFSGHNSGTDRTLDQMCREGGSR